ncbi:HNH endonuclease signature motif containing protein [Pseudonocardia sp. NPDC046786]|uniref:HNH endonuclease signature motif containing protein n=1 Tax=Pseudonocardia sp. NPDC046786 TaxID=3155471 RepID=UPI0033D2C793
MFDRIAAALDTLSGPTDADDTRDNPERAAETLAELCGFALAHAPPDAARVRRAAPLEFGGQLGPAALRMLACDAAVLPVVFGGDGRPVDVGRARPTVADPQRRAVIARDRGCAHSGCDRPPPWCEVHHVLPWERGGPTDMDNLVLLCRVHHRLVHHTGWEIRMDCGRPESIPPGWTDPQRRPRRKPDPNRIVPPPGPAEDLFPGAGSDARGDLGAPRIRSVDVDELTAGIGGR